MYKLFLTFRYLTRKAIVIFPILVVWLCVMMMIIVTSIMGGFVERVQEANRQLSGDIVIEAPSLTGFPYYEELQAELAKMPEVVTSTPLVRAYGLINLPQFTYNHFAQVVGIDPVKRSQIGDFRQSLFRQYRMPLETAEDLTPRLPANGQELSEYAAKAEGDVQDRFEKLMAADVVPLTGQQLGWRMAGAIALGGVAIFLLIIIWRYRAFWRWVGMLGVLAFLSAGLLTGWKAWAQSNPDKLRDRMDDQRETAIGEVQRAARTMRQAITLDPKQIFKNKEELVAAFMPKEPSFTPPPEALERLSKSEMPEQGCILGIDVIPMFKRDRRGNYQHALDRAFVPAQLTIVPLNSRGGIVSQPQRDAFVIVDDSYTRVYDVDSTFVYAPFKKVQEMAWMQARTDEDGVVHPARCSELQVKVKDGTSDEQLRAIAQRMNTLIAAFAEKHEDLQGRELQAQTWDEKQAKYIEAVRNEKRLITFILGLMSLVVLVVIFLIFYMIVRDKTRDIGIIKALGGSEEGVAAIFVLYGLFIGLVGGILGMITGVAFVWHTNEIHEWIYRTTGFMLWNRTVYIFDRIPDTVSWPEVLTYVVLAILAGLIGALLPAIVAGVQDPVKAVRYE